MAAAERLICDGAALVDGGAGLRFEVEVAGRTESAFAIRYRGQVFAYLNRCAHVPVELDWRQGDFFTPDGDYLICASHGALYSPLTGQCLGGRCHGKGLHPLAVRESAGKIYLLLRGNDGTEQD